MAWLLRDISSRGPEGAVPGWRRSKQIDGFRERPGEIHVPVLLDDPILANMNCEDLKSFLDVGETCLVDARYKPAKFVRNQTRILLNNEWKPENEPDFDFHSRIGWADCKKMISTTFNDPSMPHLMAILKRATIVLAGDKAVYVRLASEHQSAVIHRFEGDGLTEDWLSSRHKSFFGKYKDGQFVKYKGFEQALESEATLIGNWLASPEDKKYMRRGATYDSWAAQYGSDSPDPTAPATPRSRPMASTASPLISSPPAKIHNADKTDNQEMTISQELEHHLSDVIEAGKDLLTSLLPGPARLRRLVA